MQQASVLREILRRVQSIEERLASPDRPPLYLDQALQRRFLAWSKQQGNTDKWVRAQRLYLAWWAQELQGVDLRKATLEQHLLPALDRAQGGRTPRIAVIKRLYSWLRLERHELSPAEDPTYGQLAVPQSTPAQLSQVKAISREQYLKLRQHLSEHWRQCAEVLAATGWHVTELERFIRRGSVQSIKGRYVLVCPRTKRGVPLRTRVTSPVARSALALRQRGTFSEKRFRIAIQDAAARARVQFSPGAFRHSVATHAVNAGDAPAAVAAFLGHQSERTLRTFYATHATPRRVHTLADR